MSIDVAVPLKLYQGANFKYTPLKFSMAMQRCPFASIV